MKKLWLIISSLFAINFASAVELNELLAEIDTSLVILVALFLISFALAFFALNRMLKGNSSIAGIISVVVAFLVVYGVNKAGWDTESTLLNIGLSESSLALALFLIITAGIVFMFVKLEKKRNAFLILGALMIALSFFVYTKALLIVVGIILLVIWFIISISNKNPGKEKIKVDKKSGYISRA